MTIADLHVSKNLDIFNTKQDIAKLETQARLEKIVLLRLKFGQPFLVV